MKTLITLVVSLLLLAGCTKENTCSSGTGGDLTLVIFPEHHGKPIYSQEGYRDTVMVKFNTQEFPGASPSLYDLVLAGDSGEDHIHITGMKCGDYYLYCAGFDTSISQRVTGGMPYSTSQTSGELDIKVPVTE